MSGPIGIIAGSGALPRCLASHCLARGQDVYIVALAGFTDPSAVIGLPHCWIRVGAAGQGLRALRRQGCRDIVMVGGIRRPSLWELRPDWTTARFLGRLGWKALGDDGVLRSVIKALEAEGFRVHGIHEYLSELLAPAGTWGAIAPDDDAMRDVHRGAEVVQVLGSEDIGQAAAVQGGIVLGVEGIEGTDGLIERCGGLMRRGPGPVLVKMPKPQQERRADLPTIGEKTVRKAAQAGFRGVAVASGETLVVDIGQTVQAADAEGLFLYGIQARDSR